LSFRELTKGGKKPGDLAAPKTRQTLPLPAALVHEEPRKITQEEREFNAYKTLRNNRAEARYEGARKIRAAKASCNPLNLPVYPLTAYHVSQKEEEEAAKKK
jgi:hypothetical protein